MGQVSNETEEGVEVVLDKRGHDKVVDPPSRPTPDQNVFRGHYPPRSSSRGRPPYASHPNANPYVQGSGSFSYGHHAASSGEYPPRPYPVPPYNPSGSFDDGYHAARGGISQAHSQHSAHFSPHIQYPPPRYPAPDDINVISPNHKTSNSSASARRPPRGSQYAYQYPPTSPVSRTARATASPPRLRNFAVRGRGLPPSVEGPYSKAQRSSGSESHPEDGTWNPFPAPSRTGSAGAASAAGERPQPPLVTESSFDSDHYTRASHYSHPSHPPTPASHAADPHGPPPMHHHHAHNHHPALAPSSSSAQQQFYGPGSWASFDSAPPPTHYDDPYGPPHASHHRSPYPESPYSPYSHHSGYGSAAHYSPGAGYYPTHDGYHPGAYPGYGPPPHSYDEVDERGMLKDYHPDRDSEVFGSKKRNGKDKTASGIVLPKAASEIDFEVTDPPMEPVLPPSDQPLVESLADVNTYDVLCGRGGGTNSQIGNKRFRKLVQEFQPTYLLARRKEKPLLARTIVLIIRKRGGRFLRKDEETGMLYEVGDTKAEAKTSQALREGLDVRATKSAANTSDKKKKKKKGKAKEDDSGTPPESPTKAKQEEEESPEDEEKKQDMEDKAKDDAVKVKEEDKPEADAAKSMERSPERTPERQRQKDGSPSTPPKDPESPPTLPRLADEEIKAGMVHPHSPEALQFRKRRRMPALSCGADKFFPDFCPPRADLARAASPILDSAAVEAANGIVRDHGKDEEEDSFVPMRKSSIDHEDEEPVEPRPSCTNIVAEIMTGVVTGGLCPGPKWKSPQK